MGWASQRLSSLSRFLLSDVGCTPQWFGPQGALDDGPCRHVCGRAAAAAYIQHLLAPQVLALPVCGIAGVSRVVIHRDGEGEQGVANGRSLGPSGTPVQRGATSLHSSCAMAMTDPVWLSTGGAV